MQNGLTRLTYAEILRTGEERKREKHMRHLADICRWEIHLPLPLAHGMRDCTRCQAKCNRPSPHVHTEQTPPSQLRKVTYPSKPRKFRINSIRKALAKTRIYTIHPASSCNVTCARLTANTLPFLTNEALRSANEIDQPKINFSSVVPKQISTKQCLGKVQSSLLALAKHPPELASCKPSERHDSLAYSGDQC